MALGVIGNSSGAKLLSALAGKPLLGFDTRSWTSAGQKADAAGSDIPGRKPAFGGAKPTVVGAKPVSVGAKPRLP